MIAIKQTAGRGAGYVEGNWTVVRSIAPRVFDLFASLDANRPRIAGGKANQRE